MHEHLCVRACVCACMRRGCAALPHLLRDFEGQGLVAEAKVLCGHKARQEDVDALSAERAQCAACPASVRIMPANIH